MTINTIMTTAASFAMPAAVVMAAAALAVVAAAIALVAGAWRAALVADVVTDGAVIATHAMADSSLDNRRRGYVVLAKSAKKSPKSVKSAAPPRGLIT